MESYIHRKEGTMETSKSLLKKTLLLKPQDRFLLIDGLVRSLDEPNKEIDEIWAEEDLFSSVLPEKTYVN